MNPDADIHVNYKQKDRLFRKLFDGVEYKENLLSLYNAVNGTDYTDASQLEITTIEDVIFLGMKNDTSFILDCRMHLYEQQSTFCPNMPFRGLCYFVRLGEKYIKQRKLNLYGTKKILLPAPQYIIFCNDNTDMEDRIQLRLSDMFEGKGGNGAEIAKNFEWTATLLNINLGHNRELMEKCRPLLEYSKYVEKLKRYCDEMSIEEASVRTVDECIEEGILADFLIRHRAEVLNMILTEYNEKETLAMFFRDGKEEGRREGRQEGEELGLRKGEEAGSRNAMERVVRRMKERGKTAEEICELTGLSLEELNTL